MRLLALLLVLGLAPGLMPVALADGGKPKFGPDAVPVTTANDYLRSSPAPDYWKLAPFYLPQATGSACTVASVAMALNFLRGLPPGAEDPLVTSAGLLTAVADPSWTERAAEDGPGLRFDELVTEVTAALRAYGLERDVTVETFRPRDASPDSLARLRAVLSVNEASDRDVVLAYFNQGVLTGDWDGPHVSPLGAFDAARGRVLVMDVDREWYVPYWSPEARLLDAMLKPAPAGMGSLAGETGGLIWLKPAR